MMFKKQPYVKRMLAFALVAAMLFAQLPVSAFAEGASEVEGVTPGNSAVVETPEVEPATPEGVLTLGAGVSVEAKTLYAFTPEQSGIYCFYSAHEGNSDPYMTLLDADKKYLAESDDDGGELNFELHYEMTAGTTYYVEADTCSNKFPYELYVAESEISGIEIVSVPTFVTEEYDFNYGGWTSVHQDEIVDRYFVYHPYTALREVVLKVNYKDGTSKEISAEDEIGRGIYYEWDFYNDPWEVGTDNHYYITYKGLKVLANATVTASPVTGIELLSANIPEFIQYDGTNGYWQNYYQNLELDEKFFCYAIEQISDSIKLKVTYEDGTTEEVSYYNEEKEYTGIRVYSDQYKKNWTVGENEFEIWYRGAYTTATATVVENPVASIRVIKGDGYQFTEFDENWGHWIDESQGHFYYDSQEAMWDVVLEVTNKDGTTETVEFDYGSGISYEDNQYEVPWTPDGENTLTIIYMGASTTINITVKPSIVASIAVEDVTVTEGTHGSFYQGGDYDDIFYWYHYDIYADDITVTLTDGTVVQGNEDQIREQVGYSIRFSSEKEQYYDEPWTVGEYAVTASLLGKKAQFKYTIVESNVASITVEDLELEQYNNGYWDRSYYWDPETEEHVEVEWFRYQPDEKAQITVEFKDGNTFTGSVYEFGEKYGTYPQTPTDQSYDKQWQLGQTYTVKAYLMGKSADFSVSIVEPNVKKIEVIDTEDFSYYENDTSYGEWRDGFFWYSAWEMASRVTIRVTYKDGTTEDISWMDENGNHTGITYSDDQYQTPWTIGGENPITIRYQGASTTVSAVIEPSPIASIVVEDITHIQNTGGQWNEIGYWDENGDWVTTGKYYYYYYDPQNITITYTDGTVVSGTREEIYRQTGRWPDFHAEQNGENQWGIGEHTATIDFMGKSAEYTIRVTESDIQSITASDMTFMEGTGGYYNRYDPSEGELAYWYYYDCEPDEITVTYKDGSSITGTFEEIYQQTGYYPELLTDQSYDAQWSLGTHTVTIAFMGATDTFDVTITPTNVKSIAVEPVTYYELTNGWWNEQYDETGRHEYYHYSVYLDKITITYNDDTVVSGTWDEIYQKTGFNVYTLYEQNYYNQWGIGTHTVMVCFGGVSTETAVNIVESPLESITVDTVYLEEGTHGSWGRYIEWGYRYHYNPVPENITITYKDGTVLTGSYDELYQQLNGEISYGTFDQAQYPWGVGTYTATFTYLGTTVEYDVVITPTRIQSITVLPVIAVAGEDGWMSSEYCDPDSGNWYAGEWYEYSTTPEIIKVTFTDGTEFIGSNEDFNQLGYATRLIHDQSYFNEWGAGIHPVTLHGMGFEATYNVEILEKIEGEEFSYVVMSDGTAALVGYHNAPENVVIPETIDGYTVTVLGDHLFQYSDIQTVTIPATVRRIERYAFSWCNSLTKVLLHAGMEIICEYAFVDCYNLESVIFYGTEEEAEAIVILSDNDYLKNAQWRYAEECTEHEYDDACDAECNICYAEREPEHAYEWVIDYAGNCLYNGWKHEECALCHITRNDNTEIPADGTHDNTERINAYEATCSSEGYTGDLYCNDCYTTIEYGETIPAKGHQNTEILGQREATCGKAGYTGDLYCYDCRSVLEQGQEIPKKEHTNTELIGVREATCGEPGYTGDLYCNDCNTTIEYGEEILAKEHTNTELVGVREATCGQPGYTGDKYCNDCEAVIEYGETIPATGNHGALTIVNAAGATCNQAGYTGDVYCKDCQTVVEQGEEIPATGKHVYDNGYDTDCNECGATREVTLQPATLSMNSVTGYQGDTLRVDVSIEGNTGFAGLQFGVLFDNTYLTLKDVETQMEGFYVTVGNSIVFDAIENYTSDGVIATLIFEVAEDAPVGEYAVQLRFMSGSTEDFEAVVMTGSATTIKVESAVAGDVNGDGKVDTVDLVMLRKYLASMDPITKVSEIEVKKGADYNNDGAIDAVDLAYVRQYLASMSAG